jgi:hypothetical protein
MAITGVPWNPTFFPACPSSGGLMAMAGLENVAIYGRFRSSPAEVLGPELARLRSSGGRSDFPVTEVRLTSRWNVGIAAHDP